MAIAFWARLVLTVPDPWRPFSADGRKLTLLRRSRQRRRRGNLRFMKISRTVILSQFGQQQLSNLLRISFSSPSLDPKSESPHFSSVSLAAVGFSSAELSSASTTGTSSLSSASWSLPSPSTTMRWSFTWINSLSSAFVGKDDRALQIRVFVVCETSSAVYFANECAKCLVAEMPTTWKVWSVRDLCSRDALARLIVQWYRCVSSRTYSKKAIFLISLTTNSLFYVCNVPAFSHKKTSFFRSIPSK